MTAHIEPGSGSAQGVKGEFFLPAVATFMLKVGMKNCCKEWLHSGPGVSDSMQSAVFPKTRNVLT